MRSHHGVRFAAHRIVAGKTIAEARQLRREELVKAIGGLPKASLHASHLAMDALNAALKYETINKKL